MLHIFSRRHFYYRPTLLKVGNIRIFIKKMDLIDIVVVIAEDDSC